MNKLDKRYTLFAFQVLGPFVALWALWQYATLPLLLLSVVMFFLFRCIGAVITFHRILGHRTHKMHPVVEFICTGLGYYGSLSSPIEFCASHVHHHKYVDTWDDPHPYKLLGWNGITPMAAARPASLSVVYGDNRASSVDISGENILRKRTFGSASYNATFQDAVPQW